MHINREELTGLAAQTAPVCCHGAPLGEAKVRMVKAPLQPEVRGWASLKYKHDHLVHYHMLLVSG